jgi:hypothetical protein
LLRYNIHSQGLSGGMLKDRSVTHLPNLDKQMGALWEYNTPQKQDNSLSLNFKGFYD